MIKASQTLKDFIKAQKSMDDFAKNLDVTRQTIYNILDGVRISSDMLEKIMNKTGMSFEKAFETDEN